MRLVNRRRILAAVLGGGSAALFWACGEEAPASAPAPDSAASTPAPGTGAGAVLEPVIDDALEPTPGRGSLLLYSGRNEDLVAPLIEQARAELGLEIGVRYGSSAGQAAAILEEGDSSPADLFYSQDAGSIGALQKAGRLSDLPRAVLDLVDPRFRSRDGQWVGISGRARVFVYNTELIAADELPQSVTELTESSWEGRTGWAPGNGSFQAFVSAMRELRGDDATVEWLKGMDANDTRAYPKNTPIVEATCLGEIDGGLVNHYYLLRRLAQEPDLPCANHFFADGDVGNLINVSSAGIVKSSQSPGAAADLIGFLLSAPAQSYFRDKTFEYPLAAGVEPDASLPPLETVQGPDFDLGDMDDLDGTLALLESAGLF
ncbi:MAG: iron ABC transporter substrate-binding protein [Chloroflexi bacterium]|nr:iron ABC transporter substrate-binding protein [Chloroflexota bacterium]